MNDLKTLSDKDRIEGSGKLAVILMDQEAQTRRFGFKFPYQLSGLLRDPDLVGLGREPGEMNTSGAQFNEE